MPKSISWTHFLDKEYGGVYWSVDYKGHPLNTRKQFYAIGFALYGMSEYARATGDREALECALQLFDCIEEHALDPCYNGYIEAKTRDWQPIADMRLSELDANFPKSQNTHLHIIEPYANLLRCLKEFHNAACELCTSHWGCIACRSHCRKRPSVAWRLHCVI